MSSSLESKSESKSENDKRSDCCFVDSKDSSRDTSSSVVPEGFPAHPRDASPYGSGNSIIIGTSLESDSSESEESEDEVSICF